MAAGCPAGSVPAPVQRLLRTAAVDRDSGPGQCVAARRARYGDADRL